MTVFRWFPNKPQYLLWSARNRNRATICHHLFQFSTLCKGTWYSNGNCSSGSAACIQLEIYALSAGCSLLISPGRCLGLEPKWHCHFGIPRQRTHLYYVSILMMGCLWGFAGVDILRTSTLPFSPADHHASDIGVAATSQKVYQLTAYNSYS